MPVLRRSTRPERTHLPAGERIPPLIAADLLAEGELHPLGRLTEASNSTWLTRLADPDDGPLAVYKPISGERPLWDFADGTLAARERAAYLVSELGGWGVVPRTLLRDGPAGPGMVQEWIGSLENSVRSVVRLVRPGEELAGLIPVLRAHDEDGGPLLIAHEDANDVRSLVVLDCVLNNTDRKGAHAFRHAERLYAVDHGVTFHVEPKLRTVLWGWGGKRLPTPEVERLTDLTRLLDGTGAQAQEVCGLLAPREYRALRRRIEQQLTTRRHPASSGDWPSIPWPPI